MALGIKPTGCCGLDEINNISQANNAAEIVDYVAKQYSPNGAARRPVPFLLFTGVTLRRATDHASGRQDDYGQALEDYILKNELGTITRTDARTNFRYYLHSSNDMRVWIWSPNWEKLSARHRNNIAQPRPTL